MAKYIVETYKRNSGKYKDRKKYIPERHYTRVKRTTAARSISNVTSDFKAITDIEKKVHRAIREAAIISLAQTQYELMAHLKSKYEQLGLEEHELTGNTRASIRSRTYTHGGTGNGKFDRLMSMDDTPRPTRNILRPNGGNSSERSGGGDASRLPNGWKYFLVKKYRRKAGDPEYIRYPSFHVIDTGLVGKSDVYSDMWLNRDARRFFRNKGKGTFSYGIAFTAMYPTYRAEMVDLHDSGVNFLTYRTGRNFSEVFRAYAEQLGLKVVKRNHAKKTEE